MIVVLAPQTREVEASFTAETSDAKGIRWSSDGALLAVWEAVGMAATVHIYTADGQLFKKWADEQPRDDDVGLGVERIEWAGQNLCIGMGDGRVIILGGKTVILQKKRYPRARR